MWQRGVHTRLRKPARTKKHSRPQAKAVVSAGKAHPTRFKAALDVDSSKRDAICPSRLVCVTAEDAAGALPKIGDHDDIGFVIAGAGFDPGLPFTHVVREAHVRV